MIRSDQDESPSPEHPQRTRLPLPTRPLQIGKGVVEEHIIPDRPKAEVLEHLYIFPEAASLDEELFDLHEGRTFVVRDYRVTWENGRNRLVRPSDPNREGTVIDWRPLPGHAEYERAEHEENQHKDADALGDGWFDKEE